MNGICEASDTAADPISRRMRRTAHRLSEDISELPKAKLKRVTHPQGLAMARKMDTLGKSGVCKPGGGESIVYGSRDACTWKIDNGVAGWMHHR